MKCVIPGLNIKLFARAVHSLARVGDELYVEPTSSGVFFRTVNSSRSAYGSYFFKSGFFSLYDFKVTDAAQEENFKCKVAIKACLNAFKSVSTIDKTVEKCRLVIDPQEDRLVVNMTCRHGINKTYNLSFIECETLKAVFDKSACRFRITSQSRVLCDAFVNFQQNQEEVILSATSEKIIIRNYVDDDPDPAKSIHTELTLECDEFDSFHIDEKCEVTFCLKELRSLLSFSEPATLPVSFVFAKPGSPIIFSVENPSLFEANFVLATLSSSNSSQMSSRSLEGTECQLRLSNNVSSASGSKSPALSKRLSEVISSESEVMRNQSMRRRSSEVIDDGVSSVKISKQHTPSRSSVLSPAGASSALLTERKHLAVASPIGLGRASFGLGSPRLNGGGEKGGKERKEENGRKGKGGGGERREENGGEEDDGMVPGTPPAKRRRFFFKRCFEPTFDQDNISAFKRILAEDSDEDD